MTNWNDVLVRCSCIGKIMANSKGSVLTEKQGLELERLLGLPSRTEKQEITLQELLAKKDAVPELSETAKSYLKEVYMYHKYGKESLGGSERSKYTIKGRSVEEQSIMMLSRIDGLPYEKNQNRFTDKYLTGEPDVIVRDKDGGITKIIDIKSSWDGASLLSNIGSPLNPLYYWQINGYMALTGAVEAEVCYCLVNMPQEIIEGEKKRIFYTMNPATEENLDYKKAIERLENAMTFDEIPIRERLVRFSVKRDEDVIEKIQKRVIQCREWLAEFEKMHTTINEI
jgi:hypothetical protein